LEQAVPIIKTPERQRLSPQVGGKLQPGANKKQQGEPTRPSPSNPVRSGTM